MWLFTEDGFFSVVNDAYCNDDELMIRARSRTDLRKIVFKLERIRKRNRNFYTTYKNFSVAQIIKIRRADYRYRLKVPRKLWACYMMDIALKLDYSNVKDRLAPWNDPLRHDAYLDCWEALFYWQMQEERRR